TLFEIAKSLVQAGFPDKAIESAKLIEDSYNKSSTLSEIAKSLVQAGFPDKAIESAKINENDFNSSTTFFGIEKTLSSRIYENLVQLIELINVNRKIYNYQIAENSFNTPKKLWNYLITQCIDYPDIP